MDRLVLIDGNALVHRAFHAVPPHFRTSKGEQTNAVYGFSNVFLNIINEFQPEYLAVSFDRKAPTFRHEAYEDYKAKRVKAPQELYDQLPRIKEVVQAFGVPIYEIDGYEADDVLGTLAKLACGEGKEVMIVTGDLDTLQLVNDCVKVCTYHKGFQETLIYDADKVRARYSLSPNQIVDFKALSGDASDNIKGVPGIGKVTATKLLQAYGSVDGIYAALRDGSFKGFSQSVKNKLEQGREDAYLSQKLATIVLDVPIQAKLDEMRYQDFDLTKVAQLFSELEFVSLLKKLHSSGAELLIEADPKTQNNPQQGSLF